ncbi:T9SS type A sorting domain-containing protein [Dyadobacter sp. CY327]|uniref:T9SS type A sorting domain-containing protein n=1 Tax=Dyadobacter sp. CY327 TaxID=2907301 RepID=UPI001F384C48|nr:T9SS type A sorting domain-containing protein [Dyadobacter sp. CY327]MCE7070998.1 T9SS type A sorting domain-containing protein [Dyadobacter sp. CY327]
MGKLYKYILSATLVCIVSLVAYGQGGVVKSSRNAPFGVVSFASTQSASGFSNEKHVDGYVKKYGSTIFSFPVGHKGFYRPFAAESAGTLGAYFLENPSSASLPAGAPFNVANKDPLLKNVSSKEFWDINGVNPTRITLSWDAASDMPGLTENVLSLVTVAGWNTATGKWEKIASSVDEASITGGGSTLTTGSVTTVQAITPDTYSIYTLASLASASLPSNYKGTVEVVSCSEIRGWVWDQNYPDADLTIELYEGSVVYATTKANIYREDLKNNGTGTGNYGFTIAPPASLMDDGKTHQFSVRLRGTSFVLGGSPKSLSCAYSGNFEATDCYTIKGWAWDMNRPDTAVTVEILEGNTLIASAVANVYRDELKVSGVGTGFYGFTLNMPNILRDGKAHQVSIRIKNTTYQLSNSPRSVTCALSFYQGSFEAANCNTVEGWIWDKNYPNTIQTVELVEGNTVLATGTASIYKEYLKTLGYGTGNYGFKIALPASLKDGQAHQLGIRLKGSTTLLSGSPKTISCSAKDYAGYFEAADCNTVAGWAWDKNDINAAVVVELLENGTVYATATANIYKEYIKTAGHGTGKYGFSIPLPAALKDGKAHQLSIRVQGSTVLLNNSPKTVTCATSLYQGTFEAANCNTVEGWAWDKNNPSVVQTVELVEGNTVLATGTASIYKEYLKTLGYGTGNYGFKIALPASLKDGQAHQLGIRLKGSTTLLSGSPKTISCSAKDYAGYFEAADCNTVAGWAWDKNDINAAVVVELLENGTVYATATANIYKEYIKTAGHGTGKYGFSIPLPAALKDGKAHQLSIRVQGSTVLLNNSPKTVTCATSLYQGTFEAANCNTVEGWAWDKNNPSVVQTVELVEGNTVLATGTASIYKEYLKTLGYGTGNYGFKIALPASLKDGQAHQLGIRLKGSTTLLSGSPKTISCSAKDYAGYFEAADCNTVAGWAWDKNDINAAVVVELLENGTVYATATANIYKEYIKTAGHGTGKYGFSIPLPAALKDGKAHQLSIRVQGSTVLLNNSPKTVTCASTARMAASEGLSINREGESIQPDMFKSNLSVFPNPTSGKIRVTSAAASLRPIKISIIDISGRIVWVQSVNKGEYFDEFIDISSNSDGVYIVRLEGDDILEIERIVLTK